jgi:CHAT domain-containing protein
LAIEKKAFGPDHPHVGLSLNNLSVLYVEQKKYSKAEPLMEKALRITHFNKDIVNERLFQANIGYLLKNTGRIPGAISHFKKAVSLLENLRRQFKVEEVQQSFMKDKMGAYKQLVLLLLEQGEIEEAFSYVERAKSRAFLDMLGNHKLGLKDAATQEQLEKERMFQNRINSLIDRTRKERSKPGDQQRAVLSEWDTELVEAQKDYRKLLLEIKKSSPELSSLVSVDPLQLKKVQKLIDKDEAIIEYFVTENKTIAFIIERKKVDAIQIDVRENKLKAKIQELRESLSKQGYLKDRDAYEAPSKELYDLLLKPALLSVKAKRLCIVPHGALHYLPFHMLADEKEYLIDKYEIFYSPSASVQQFCLQKRKDAKAQILALGNPDYEDKLPQLPFAEAEINKIKKLFPETAAYTGKKATESVSKLRSSEMSIVHFATHAEFNEYVPIFSSIRLTKDESEDGRLEVHEIFGLDLSKASLVTLSGCESGLSKIGTGDELIGLPRAFIYAGTPSVLASLWKVDDLSTALLMTEFYKNLKTMPKSLALQQAQISIRNTCKDNHPIFWAPFVLIGDWK